jgi:hypothetical protein
MLVATESRFGLLGFAMLPVHALQMLANRSFRPPWSFVLPGLLIYVALSFLFNTMMMQNADMRL